MIVMVLEKEGAVFEEDVTACRVGCHQDLRYPGGRTLIGGELAGGRVIQIEAAIRAPGQEPFFVRRKVDARSINVVMRSELVSHLHRRKIVDGCVTTAGRYQNAIALQETPGQSINGNDWL